jgi:ABC-type polar amino acid transport system ATPase subunit
MEQLARDGMTTILETHKMSFAQHVTNQTIFMHKGTI